MKLHSSYVVWTLHDIRSPVFYLPDIRHSFAEQSIRYCLTPQNLSIEICVQKISVCIYVKIALTKKKKKILKILPAKKLFFL